MSIDVFADRLGRVRRRFVSTLQGRIDDTSASLDKLAAKAPAAGLAVGEAYRCVHSIVGVGTTVGFPATGRAAHDVEDVLRPAQKDSRGLSEDEMSLLTQSLAELRAAAAREIQDFYRELKVSDE